MSGRQDTVDDLHDALDSLNAKEMAALARRLTWEQLLVLERAVKEARKDELVRALKSVLRELEHLTLSEGTLAQGIALIENALLVAETNR